MTLTLHFLSHVHRLCTKPAESDTVEATDRFGSVLTLRLVRRHNGQTQGYSFSATTSAVTGGRLENNSEAWSTRLVGTAMGAGKASAVTPSADFAAGARLRDQEETPLESGREAGHAFLHQFAPLISPPVL